MILLVLRVFLAYCQSASQVFLDFFKGVLDFKILLKNVLRVVETCSRVNQDFFENVSRVK